MGEETIQTRDGERDEEGGAESVTVSVVVLGQQGKSALVEWGDTNRKRGYIPLKAVVDGAVDEAVLDAAIPYGVAWEELIDLSHVTAQAVGDSLRKANIWTVGDLEAMAIQARKAINRVMGPTLGALRRAAQQLEEV